MRRLSVYNTQSLDGDHIWKQVDQFAQTYWSGLDSRMYAGEVFLDDIVSLEYRLFEAVMPSYSYASYTFDVLSHGARRVEGTFTINFKRDSYIYELLRKLRRDANAPGRVLPDRQGEAFRVASSLGGATIDTFVALAAGDGHTVTDDRKRKKFDPLLLNQVANDFEAAIWGEPIKREQDENIRRQTVVNELLALTRRDRPRFEVPGQWDLFIHFGSVDADEQSRRKKQAGAAGRTPQELSNISVNTNSKIVRVGINGVSRVVDDSGKPILEVYTFVAQDVI